MFRARISSVCFKGIRDFQETSEEACRGMYLVDVYTNGGSITLL
jgi:hypothetical protein